MNFTREPIIETIITPKEGSKLVVRSSKAEGQEEYLVDAVEVVSFGQALFFRCTERPKPFLVPVSDYEVVEAKEARVVLKNAQFDRTIKIGGGRDASIRRESVEKEEESSASPEEEPASSGGESERSFDRRREGGRGRDRGRHRRRRAHEEREEMKAEVTEQESSSEEAPAPKPQSEVSSTTLFTSLIPPPTTLISDTIGRYKEMLSDTKKQEEPTEKPEEKNQPEEGSGNSLSRAAASPGHNLQSTNFAPLTDWTNFLS